MNATKVDPFTGGIGSFAKVSRSFTRNDFTHVSQCGILGYPTRPVMVIRCLPHVLRFLLASLPLATQAQLNGTYVIDGGGGGAYTTFAAAINDLNLLGVSGPVVFEVTNGIYNGRATIGAITGASAVNTVTFRGQSLDSSLVTWWAPTTTTVSVFSHNSLLRLNGTDFVTFEHMTLQRTGVAQYGHVVVVEGATSNLTIQHCKLRGATNYTGTQQDRNLVHVANNELQLATVLRNNRMEYGNFGLYWWALSNEPDELVFEGNDLLHSTVRVQNVTGRVHVLGNTSYSILAAINTSVMNANGDVRISRNSLRNTGNFTTLQLQGLTGTLVQPVEVANNMVLGPFSALNVVACNMMELLHNSSSGPVSIANGNSDIRMLNNIWYRDVGYALTVGGTATFLASDHNCYHSASGNAVLWNGAHNAVASLTTATGLDANSLFLDPQYVSTAADLHIQTGSPCAGTGTATAGAVDDLDLEVRPRPASTEPDIGADETDDYCFTLNGTFVIGPSAGADFTDFAAAVLKMASCGIAGPVVFEVEDGTYTEQLVLPPITGSSALNTITFRGQSLDSSLVSLSFNAGNSPASNYLLSFQGMDHVTFEHMRFQRCCATPTNRYSRVVDFPTSADPSQNITFSHLWFNGSLSTTYGYNYAESIRGVNTEDNLEVVVEYCRFQGGGPAFYWDGDHLDDRLTVTGCRFQFVYDGLSIQEIAQPMTITWNTMENFNTTYASTDGVALQDVTAGFTVSHNFIRMPRGRGIILVDIAAPAPAPGLVHNNMVHVNTSNTLDAALMLSSGIANVHVLNNSLSVSSGRAFHMAATSATGLRFVNNLATAYSMGGYPVFASLTTFAECSHNALFNHSSTGNIAWWNGTPCSDMSTLQASSGLFSSSIATNPMVINNSFDLHLQSGSPCLGGGMALVEVADDHDGETRPAPIGSYPDIGADEHPEACAPLAGTYVIGTSAAADFPTFSATVARLTECGISGPVVFQVEPGTYTEAITFPPVSGTSLTDDITYRGVVGDSTQVVLNYPATATANPIDHVLVFDGVDHVTFRDMTIERFGPGTYGDVIRMNPGISGSNDPSEHVTVSSCRILRTGGSGTNRILVNASNFPALNEVAVRFEGNYLSGGYYAFGNPGNHGDEWIIQDNVIENCTGGILIFQAAAVTIIGNKINGNVASTQPGMRITCDCPANVLGNKVVGRGRALELTVAPPPGQRAVIANNSLIVSGGAVNGVELIGLNRDLDLQYNSISTVNGRGVSQSTGTGSSGITFQNNAIKSTGNMAIFMPWAGAITTASHQALVSGAANLASWNGTNCGDLAALQANSGLFSNSVAADPMFFDPIGDLHAYAMEIDAAATPLAGINTDIDGDPRDPIAPDIGCDEFTPQLWNEQFDVCITADAITSTGSGTDRYIYRDRKVVARFNDNGQNLGTVTMDVYVNSGAVRQSLIGQYYLDRNWRLSTQVAMSSPVRVTLYHSVNEFNLYAATDPVVTTFPDAGVAHYAGPMEDCDLLNNPAGNTWTPVFPADPQLEPSILAPGGTHRYQALINDDGELYITTQGDPLPVELLSFSGDRIDRMTVGLNWSTATERDNAGFEIWRRMDGEATFERVGWVEGAGNSQHVIQYAFTDPNTSSEVGYYRLRQIDHDGTVKDSPLIAVAGASFLDGISVFPNPTPGVLEIQGDQADLDRLSLLDHQGRNVKELALNSRLDLSELPRGTYFLRFRSSRGEFLYRRIVLN